MAAVGLLTGVVGISLALYQRDVKRVLAYSSIENMGLIVLVMGVALWGRANKQPVVAALAMTGVNTNATIASAMSHRVPRFKAVVPA